MYELLAIAIGVCAGAGVALTASRATRIAMVAAGLAGAVAVFALSGEVDISPAFLLWDLAQVTLAGALSALLMRRLAGIRSHRE